MIFELKKRLTINNVKIRDKKYKKITFQEFRKSNLLTIYFLLLFSKVLVSLIANSTKVLSFKDKHFSSLNNIDLIKGYLGLISLIFFSIEFIEDTGIFEM